MEDIKAYIESGILELYVLGDLTQAEKVQVEEMASKHPEVKAELDAIEASLEYYASAHAIEPTEKQRHRVLNSLLITFSDDNNFPGRTVDHTPVEDNVVPFNSPKTVNFYKYAFAACLALLIVSVVALLNVYNRLQDSNSTIASLNLQNQRFSNRVNLVDRQLSVFRDTSYKFIKLQGTPHSPASAMMVAWSPVKKKVVIDMATLKLPANDKDHQYQLWAIVNGKPVDLGVFDAALADNEDADMKEMKEVAVPQAFAVTLEPRGGSVNPTMDQMMVIKAI
ncbi:anti-sigma factor [Mucilaginibacter gynuensis]|uniref:Anti-sigma factor n=1 Tax=Mucilaginibacter gynuensis TaxID=1302236 RepID=A0ABP8GAH8_9SPHI